MTDLIQIDTRLFVYSVMYKLSSTVRQNNRKRFCSIKSNTIEAATVLPLCNETDRQL